MQIYYDHELKSYNTFGIAAKAAIFLVLETKENILIAYEKFGKPIYILGGGSNVLISKNIEGVVWQPMNTDITTTIEGDTIYLTVGAGINRNRLVRYTIEHGWRGIENLVAIPGNTGAAPVQNIGAYGVELKDVLVTCEVFDFESNTFVSLSNTDCKFGYRHSIFKEQPGKYMIRSVTLHLSSAPNPRISYAAITKKLQGIENISQQDIADTIESVRRSKLPKPKELGNTGSFFQNPIVTKIQLEMLIQQYPDMPHYPQDSDHEKLSAARLIEQSGLKGYREGCVGTYAYQPLVIVQYGGASGNDIIDFSEKIITKVFEKFGVTLIREVNLR